MADNDVPWCGPNGHGLQDLYYTLLHKKALCHVVLEKKIFYVFPHRKSMGAIGCHGNQSSDPTWP